MIELLVEPFGYQFMRTALWCCALVGAVCGFLSAYLMLKGWSLIGDALSHSVVPGVAGAYILGLPYSLGAFAAGFLAAGAMLFINQRSRLKQDAVIGLIFTGFFGAGLFMVSLSPTSVDVQTIVFGNVLAIAPEDSTQLLIISVIAMTVLLARWRELLVVFFDEAHARTVGLNPRRLKLIFFSLLSACAVTALMTVGAFLVIALVVTPGATAYLLTDRFSRLLILSTVLGASTSLVGVYLSYYLNGSTGGVIVVLQTALFLAAFVAAPRHGLLAARRRGQVDGVRA